MTTWASTQVRSPAIAADCRPAARNTNRSASLTSSAGSDQASAANTAPSVPPVSAETASSAASPASPSASAAPAEAREAALCSAAPACRSWALNRTSSGSDATALDTPVMIR
ncbi:hypothetical protein ACFQYP_02195 [Nonomuraea antimicrobica]